MSVRYNTDPGSPQRSPERGVVLIWVAAVLLLVAGMVYAAVERMTAMDRITKASYNAHGHARQVAIAGLTDAIAWMRRQPSQPILEFRPQRDPDAPLPPYQESIRGVRPPAALSAARAAVLRNDTEEPDTGLVRTFEIAPNLFGRYAVIRGAPPETFRDADSDGLYDAGETFTDTNGDGVWTPGSWSRDVSAQRGVDGAGVVWLLVARAQIFERSDKTRDLDETPNLQVATTALATEVRRLHIAVPAEAALLVAEGARANLAGRVRIQGSAGISFAHSTGRPRVGGIAEAAGTIAPVDAFDLSIARIFSVTWSELLTMADISTDDAATGLPDPLPAYMLTVIDGDVEFTRKRPLKGTGILVVRGNVTIRAGSSSFFRGLLYVDGNLTIQAPAFLQGTIIVTRNATLRGSGADYTVIQHDPTILGDLMRHMGQYRQSKAPYTPRPTHEDGRPTQGGTSVRRFGDRGTEPGYSAPVPTPSPAGGLQR